MRFWFVAGVAFVGMALLAACVGEPELAGLDAVLAALCGLQGQVDELRRSR